MLMKIQKQNIDIALEEIEEILKLLFKSKSPSNEQFILDRCFGFRKEDI